MAIIDQLQFVDKDLFFLHGIESANIRQGSREWPEQDELKASGPYRCSGRDTTSGIDQRGSTRERGYRSPRADNDALMLEILLVCKTTVRPYQENQREQAISRGPRIKGK